MPIAERTATANAQHFEVATGVYECTLGPRMKYSACLFEHEQETLDEAELKMLQVYLKKADISEGQRVLDLGGG